MNESTTTTQAVEWIRLLPVIMSGACFVALIAGRLLTNKWILNFRKKLTKDAFERIKSEPEYYTMTDNALADGLTVSIPLGAVPKSYSALYLFGLVGLLVCGIWSFCALGWWAATVGIGLYWLSRLVPSLIKTPQRY